MPEFLKQCLNFSNCKIYMNFNIALNNIIREKNLPPVKLYNISQSVHHSVWHTVVVNQYLIEWLSGWKIPFEVSSTESGRVCSIQYCSYFICAITVSTKRKRFRTKAMSFFFNFGDLLERLGLHCLNYSLVNGYINLLQWRKNFSPSQ